MWRFLQLFSNVWWCSAHSNFISLCFSDYDCVCVKMPMYIMSSGSSDIPLHNKSTVRLTKPSLCGCGPGATKGILCLHQTAFLASPVCEWCFLWKHRLAVRPSEISEDEHNPKIWAADEVEGKKSDSSRRLSFPFFLLSGASYPESAHISAQT